MDRSWIEGRFGRRAVMAAIAVTAVTAVLIIVAALATDATDDSGRAAAGGSRTAWSGVPPASGTGAAPGSRSSVASGGSSSPAGSGTSAAPSDPGAAASSPIDLGPPFSAAAGDDTPDAGTHPSEVRAADEAWLEDRALAASHLRPHYTWRPLEPRAGTDAAPGDVAGVVHAARASVVSSCTRAWLDHVVGTSSLFSSGGGLTLGELAIVTRSPSAAARVHGSLTSEDALSCLADTAADVVEAWGWRVYRIRIIDVDVDVEGADDATTRYVLTGAAPHGNVGLLEMTTTSARVGRSVLFVVTASTSRVNTWTVREIVTSRLGVLTA